MTLFSAVPSPHGLYDPADDVDSCGVAFVVDTKGRRSHKIVDQGLVALANMEHRGAAGAEPSSGDGAGILTQVPHEFLNAVTDFDLPAAGSYAVGNAMMPLDVAGSRRATLLIERIAREEGIVLLGWRDVPVDQVGAGIGPTALGCMPTFRQLFIKSVSGRIGIDLERAAFVLRKRVERETNDQGIGVYFASLSPNTIVYKGMLTTHQLRALFADLSDPRYISAIALVHSRFSTNTFPSWPLAHPFRFIAHNGEINTIKGNRNRARAREALLQSDLIPGDLKRLFPIVSLGSSDSGSFDEMLELLYLGGRSLPHAMLMMIPEAWENNSAMSPELRAFYQYHSSLMEPWDGPACVPFTNGTVIGAVLDRNGLRPARWLRTTDDLVVLASEAGVLEFPPDQIVAKGRLRPGRMFLVDTEAGRIISDTEIKSKLAAELPYEEWLHAGLVHLHNLPNREHVVASHESVLRRQLTFGYTEEELRILLEPMARTGGEALGSMGTDTPLAVLSNRSRLLYDYFSQLFAQVTNPPLDAIREELVTSLSRVLGPEQNLLDPGPAGCRHVVVPFPVIDNDELAKILHINTDGDLPGFAAVRIAGLYEVDGGGSALADALDRIRAEVSGAIENGARIIVLSDRDSDAQYAPIPSLLLTSAVHHHLIREKTRLSVGLIVESGDCREVHHVALLLGFGAAAVNPYLAFETIEDLVTDGIIRGIEPQVAIRNYVKAAGKGVLKVMSKMGISTVGSYTMAQIFEAIGLSQELLSEYFTGVRSRLGGIGLDEIATEVAIRHSRAYPDNPAELAHRRLEVGGEYQWRREGELHLFNPETVFLLQHATRSKQEDVFRRYTKNVDEMARKAGTLRGLFKFKDGLRTPIPLDEVESASSIIKRFSTGAMSYGSISAESHTDMAIAMNQIGGKSNTGEGGEDAVRLHDPQRRSAIKQVASGRFGVTSEYLVNADDIQIKVAQGAKPGEGGQLPAYKVYPWIAATRHSTAGVGLISPPPHHDIYSIEDLAQLIHDLKNANTEARVHVKLVAQVGVGTVAAGVSKAHADVVLISGHDGGTGASPLTSLKHAGAPWEVGLADTQQTLLTNNLRDRIVVQVDGQMKTARDVVIAALLGAEEYGFATAPLVVQGCVMMRVCHLDTCPVGIATQNPVLREKYSGKPEFVVTFFQYLANEVREMLAELGFRSIDEAVGRVEMLDTTEAEEFWKASGLDLSSILRKAKIKDGAALRKIRDQDHGLHQALDRTLIELARPALDAKEFVRIDLPVRNVNRTVGTMLGSEVTRRFGGAGLPDSTIDITLRGSAGQSIGAFLPSGINLRLYGDANDGVGKGLSGGRIIIRPDIKAKFVAEQNIIAGNALGYGATGGEMYLRGMVGERCCVRNSGATVVVEGVGDHACEYMTGGRVVILGPTGRNVAAGMSGGISYVLDLDRARVNPEMVEVEELDAADDQWLHETISRHLAETDSAVAAALLADWPRRVASFAKIMPRDYKRVLTATKLAEQEGRDVEAAIMEASRG